MYWGKARIFLLFCGSFTAGVFLAPYLGKYFFHFIAFSAIFFIILITLSWPKDVHQLKNTRQKWMIIGGFMGLALVLGIWRYQAVLPDKTAADFIGQFYNQKVEITGLVTEFADIRSDKIRLTISPEEIITENGKTYTNISEKLLLTLGRYPEYKYGDRLKFTGELKEPFVSEEFSYKDYLSRFGVHAVMYYADIEKIGERKANPVKQVLADLRNTMITVSSKILPEPHNSFLLGLLIGLKRGLPEHLKEIFVITGISHIVVVSGYNISIITRGLLKFKGYVGRRTAFLSALFTVLAFVILTGAEASVVRAGIMGMVLVWAMNVGRVYRVVNALIITAGVMIFLNPLILRFDIGFQLSFMATLGLILLAPVFDKLFRKIPDWLGFRTNLSSTLAAQIFTLPLLIFYFERLSLVAPLVNVLVLWAIPYTMALGTIALLGGLVYLFFGQFLAVFPWVFMEYILRIAEWFSQFDFSAVDFQTSIYVLLGFYILLLAGLYYFRRKKKFYHELEYAEVKL